MPDAAQAVTQEAVESFAEAYLDSLGARIEKDDRTWRIELPDEHPLSIEDPSITVSLAEELDVSAADTAYQLSPESPFFDELVQAAMGAQPVGRAVFTADRVDVTPPDWLCPPELDISYEFYPLYDREALCVWFQISVETVSQYETTMLRAIAVDQQTGEPTPAIATGLIEHLDRVVEQKTESRIAEGDFETALETAREAVEAEVRPELEDIERKATAAADDELAEYRQMQQQELHDIQERLEDIEAELSDVSEQLQAAGDQEARVEALTRRQELNAEKDELAAERDQIQEAINAGFPEKQAEIRERHSVRVTITPVAVTVISYERGDLDMTMTTPEQSVSARIGYAPGIGPIEDPTCDACGSRLSGDNPVSGFAGGLLGACCAPRN